MLSGFELYPRWVPLKTKAPKHNANRRNNNYYMACIRPSVLQSVTMLFLWVEQITFCFPLDVF